MQDRFKFRAWNKMTKTMKEVSQLNFSEEQIGNYPNDSSKCSVHLCWQPSMIIMQCTGLKDNNGKLIFEGDILKVTGSRDASGYGVVEYLQAGCQFFINGYLDYPSPYHPRRKGEFYQPLQEWLCTEVIGNIYENPELLEDK